MSLQLNLPIAGFCMDHKLEIVFTLQMVGQKSKEENIVRRMKIYVKFKFQNS